MSFLKDLDVNLTWVLQVCLFCNQYTAKINECYEMHENVFVGFIFYF